MSKVSQQQKILAYCQQNGSITVRDAVIKLNINSPTKRISEMNAHPGFYVDSVMEHRTNESGGDVRFKRYFIKAVES